MKAGALLSARAILELFRQDPAAGLTTTEVVEQTTPGYAAIERDLHDPDWEKVKQARFLKAQLHRKTLYYLNKLVSQGVLAVKTIQENKEKVFVLTNAPTSHAMPVTPAVPAMPIEGYEQRKILQRLEPLAWIDRLNAILLETGQFKTASELSNAITNSFTAINDALGLNDFEQFLQRVDVGASTTFLRALNQKCEDYGRHVTLVIDATNLTDPDQVLSAIKGYVSARRPKHLTFVYDVYPRELQDHKDFFEKLVPVYAEAGENLYIKNENVHDAPYIFGRAGPYTFQDAAWKAYKTELHGQIPGLVCAQATVLVDVQRFFSQYPKTTASIADLMVKIAKSLRLANESQRKRSEEFFKGIVQLSPLQAKNFFRFSKNYVRFWNYGWKTPGFDPQFLFQYLAESKKAMDEYCVSEETIYQSCGMPTRFRIAYSCAFEDAVKDFFTKAAFYRIVMKGREEFDNPQLREIVRGKEQVVRLFDGGDLMTFYRTGHVDAAAVVGEISHILTNYRVPFFRIKFSAPKAGDMSLREYMEAA